MKTKGKAYLNKPSVIMKKLKIFSLSALAFIAIASTVFVSCQKQNTQQPIETKVVKMRGKKIMDFLGLKITVEAAQGFLRETYYANGQLKSRDCDPGNAVCYTKINIGKALHPTTNGEAFVGEILIHSFRDIELWIKPQNASDYMLQNLSDGILNIDSPFGIGFDKYESDMILVPSGNYPVNLEQDGSYRIRFLF
jgi:hypothetical protein